VSSKNPVLTEFPKLVAVSGPSQGQVLTVDENGARLSEDCVVRLCDGRAVAYSIRDGKNKPWSLLDHKAELEFEGSVFRLDHPEFDPDRFLGLWDVDDDEIEGFFLGLLMGQISRPIAAAVLLDSWNAGEAAFATFLPGFFLPRYTIVNETRRQFAPGVYDETDHVFCARMSKGDRYVGALYVKSLTPVPFDTQERADIARIATYIAFFLDTKADVPADVPTKEQTKRYDEDGEEAHRISYPAEVDVVFADAAAAYRFAQKKEHSIIEQVPSPLETLLDQVLCGVFHDIEAATAAAVCLEVPGSPLHFIRLQRPDDFEIDKDVVYRAFTRDVHAACNADQSVWAVPIEGSERRLGVLYVKIDPAVKMKDLIEALQTIASVAVDEDFPENLDRLF